MVTKVFNVQNQFPSKDDWTLQIEEDKKNLNIDINEESIKKMKKAKFKKVLKEKLNKKAPNFLYTQRDREDRSKTKNLKLFGFQNYLKTTALSTKEKKTLFSLRTRMIDVKTNYRNKYKYNMQCRLCEDKSEEESEKHLLKCSKIIQQCTNLDISNAKYEDIFSEDIDTQISITKIFTFVFKTRAKLLNDLQ